MSDKHASVPVLDRSPSGLRWPARIAGLISIAVIAVVGVIHHENPFQLHGPDLLLFLCFPAAVVVGLVIGWRWEFAGGALAVAAWLAFFGTSRFLLGASPREWDFLLAAVPALLLLVSGILNRLRIRQADALKQT